MQAIAVGGIQDHVHMLLLLPTTIAIAKAVQLIKAGSSKWMNEQPDQKMFQWQTAYGAFTVGISQLSTTVDYILSQEEHHSKYSFDQEWALILKRHGISGIEAFQSAVRLKPDW